MNPLPGKTSKDSKYLALIKSAIANDKLHPRNNGIQMQAHHIISAEGMKRSGVSDKIEQCGYNINLLPNLVFIPCTLQGACHLGIQPHRGDHDIVIDQDDYIDDLEPRAYHDTVSLEVKKIYKELSKECAGKDIEIKRMVGALDSLSEKIMNLIQNKPSDAPLTKIATSFGKGSVGCAGADSVKSHSKLNACAVKRQHMFDSELPGNSQAQGQKIEKIQFDNKKKYKLRIEKKL